jgi:hypothetical protein
VAGTPQCQTCLAVQGCSSHRAGQQAQSTASERISYGGHMRSGEQDRANRLQLVQRGPQHRQSAPHTHTHTTNE